jgi:anti-sigma regulatory factor (Ser/Thr protein kinase)
MMPNSRFPRMLRGNGGIGRRLPNPLTLSTIIKRRGWWKRPAHRDELRELADTFRKAVERLSSLMREVEAAHQKTLQAEQEKKLFSRELLRAVTRGKLDLVDRNEVPEIGQVVMGVPIQGGEEYAKIREVITDTALAAGMPAVRIDDLLIVTGEAITNVLKHAVDGYCLVYRGDDSVVVRITDRGPGIHWQHLPATILTTGFSTKVSLGMGFTLMLKLADRIWLSTGPEGTLVQLEMKVRPVPESDALTLASFPSA